MARVVTWLTEMRSTPVSAKAEIPAEIKASIAFCCRFDRLLVSMFYSVQNVYTVKNFAGTTASRSPIASQS